MTNVPDLIVDYLLLKDIGFNNFASVINEKKHLEWAYFLPIYD